MEQPQQQQLLLHFSHSKHPLVFCQDNRVGWSCVGCRESVYGPSYSCEECRRWLTAHHKSCAELPIGLHHPLHPIHPLILFDEKTHYPEEEEEEEDKQKTKCQVCNESRRQYTYRCYRCDFNLHATCASLPPTIESSQVHHHPLSPFWKWMSFTCDLCAKEVKGIPNQCALCSLWFHNTCASLPRKLKVIRHNHPLHLIHSSLEVELHQSDSRFCQLCAQKVNTNYGFYYCSKCDFIAHLDCAADYRNRANVNLQELKELENEDTELDQSVYSAAYEVKNIKVGEDGTEIATEIEHFSHEHELKLSDDEVLNNEKCNGCVQAISPPFYSCVNCSFFLHESCAKLPKKKRHPLHQHLLTLFPKPYYPKPYHNDKRVTFNCGACRREGNGFNYMCETCWFNLDVSCSLISDILTHPGHEHRLLLSSIESEHNCSCCDSKISPIFRCTTCEFALDFKCATLPQTARDKQHEHPFILRYTAEDDSGEYYCDICEEKRNSKHWFYYCANCDYPVHPKCILGENPNFQELKEAENEGSELDQSVYSAAYEVKNIKVGEDGTEIATEIQHFSHEHDLKLSNDEVLNIEKCNGCVQAIFPPFYSCVNCSFFLHESCAKLPKKKRHPLHQHLLTLFPKPYYPKPYHNDKRVTFNCGACRREGNGFNYMCKTCWFNLDVSCSLISDILTHPGHEHRLLLSSIESEHNCSCCDSKISPIFRCTVCEFALDFKCATLPQTARDKQHEHPFTLCYTAKDDSGEYYCDICGEDRNPKHWFYYCANCDYPVHPKCILGNYPNIKFGSAYEFFFHPHPLTFIEETKDHLKCNRCGLTCTELFYQCAHCNFNRHHYCVY